MGNDYSIRFVNTTFKIFLLLSGLFVFAVYIPYAIIHNTTGLNQYNMDYYRSIVLFSMVLTFYSLIVCLVFLLSFFVTKFKFRPVYFYLFIGTLIIFLTVTCLDPGGVINWILD